MRRLALGSAKLHSVAFLHVGKAGGTSMDRAMIAAARRHGFTYHGNLHYDWNYILERFPQAHVLVLLRHPVQRAISQYHFSKQLSWTKGMKKYREGNINTFFEDFPTMMQVRNVWRDGEAATAWLTGTHVNGGNWVKSNESFSPATQARREERALWVRDMLLLAAGRLRRAFWVGTLEDIDNGMERLSQRLGLAEKLKFPHSNKRRSHSSSPQRPLSSDTNSEADEPTLETMRKLEDLMPMDMWVYRYAQSLIKHGDHASLPPFPEVHCMSTRYILRCDALSAMGKVYYHRPSGSEDVDARQLEVLGPNVDFKKYIMPFRFYDDTDYL